MTDSSHDPTMQQSTLLRFAKAALAEDANPQDLPWEEIDLSDPNQRRFGDYELLELLGRGGMGVVYRARHARLDREVAIKFIASNIADQPEVIGRFMAEAQAAAKLHHPNIVPVFEVGSVDCLYYFTMPLLRGKTLADLGRLPVDEAVAMMRKLCSAVSYAHSLGLLHLDLKPANVMIDEHGRPMIGDFGLARQMDEERGVTAQEVSGTPAFMAPEQVQIKQYRLTEATDLYALGAMLYQLLSGKSPHGRGSAETLMKNAIAGRIPRLREVNPSIPKDLAAICEKCLELHQEDRYEDVVALGHDLDRFIDGMPVSVRSPTLPERIRRTVSRNPALSASVAAALLALIVGFVGTTWQWREAEEARKEAEQNFESALVAANTLVSEVNDSIRPLLDTKADTVRTILESARTIYDDLGDRREVALARANVLRSLARTYDALGERQTARQLAFQSIDDARRAYSSMPNDSDAMYALAASHLYRGFIRLVDRDLDGAEQDSLRSVELSSGPSARDAHSVKFRLLEAEAHDQLGMIARRRGRLQDSLAHYQRGTDVLDALAKEHSDDPLVKQAMARHHNILGRLFFMAHDFERAVEEITKTLAITETLVASDPADSNNQEQLAWAHFELGIALGSSAESLEHLRRSAEIYADLVARDPANTERRFEHTLVRASLARRLSEPEKAIALFKEVLVVLEGLLEQDPENVKWLGQQASVLGDLGEMARNAGNYRAAADYFLQKIDIDRRLVDSSPAAGRLHGLSASLHRLGQALNFMGEPDEAIRAVDEALSIMRPLADSNQSPPGWRETLGRQLDTAAFIKLGQGQFDDALAYLAEAALVWDSLIEIHPDAKHWRWEAANVGFMRGRVHFFQGRMDRALEALRFAETQGFEYAGLLIGDIFLARKAPEEALAEAKTDPCEPCRLYLEAKAFHAVGERKKSVETLQQLIEGHGDDHWAYQIAAVLTYLGDRDRAFEWLGKASSLSITILPHDPRFDPLRNDPRWTRLLTELKG